MTDWLEVYGLNYGKPYPEFEYSSADPFDITQLAPSQDPTSRLLDKLTTFDQTSSLLMHDKDKIAALITELQQAMDYEARRLILQQQYGAYRDILISQLEARYEQELNKKKGFGFIKNLFSPINVDYLLLLKQYLYDLKMAADGTGYHAITAELKILANYAYHGPDYFKPFPEPPLDPGTTNRAVAAPDQNIIMYVSGFNSDWQGAAREAYLIAYKLGYELSDIFVFSYVNKSDWPIQLSELIDRNGTFVGDARLLADKQAATSKASPNDQELEELLDKNNKRLRHWNFSSTDNLQSSLYEKSQALATQLQHIKNNLPADQSDRRFNLICTSQGAAIGAGFMLQKNPAQTEFLMDAELNQFLDKYALFIGAHGGSYLAEARKLAGETGILVKLVENVAIFLSRWLPQLEVVQSFKRTLDAPAARDLAISSDFTAGNYRALSPENLAETTAHLKSHKGIEIYHANDDVTTSVPLLPLPGTTEIRLMTGRHGVFPPAGLGDSSYAACNKYIYHYFLTDKQPLPSLESDQLIYCGYIKKGLADKQLPIDKITLPGILGWLHPILATERAKSFLIPFLTGQAGIVDYEVEQEVYKQLNRELKRLKPAYWPCPRFQPFKP